MIDMPTNLGFWNAAQAAPGTTAVIDAAGRSITFGQLHGRSNQLVQGLRELGLQPGDAIAYLSENRGEIFELFMAAAQAGWFITPINTHLAPAEVAYILEDCGAKACFLSARCAHLGLQSLQRLKEPPRAFSFDNYPEPLEPYTDLGEEASTAPPERRSAGSPMTYTSGTTGQPKGVRRPWFEASPEQVYSQQALFLSLFGMPPGSEHRHLVVAPLYHTAVINFASNHLHLGHTVVLMDKWTPEACLEAIQNHRITTSHMVPTMFSRLLKLPAEVRDRFDVSSCEVMIHGAAPCPIEVKQDMLDWWGDCIYEYYAASEGGGTLATPAQWRDKPGTVGAPWPISTLRILDDDHQPLPVGEAGTVWIRMGEHRFDYHGDEAKTEEAWNEGFFTVGDCGYLDEDGFLFLCDRKVDMIISGGVNIYPAEIESCLITHPDVLDVAVFGIPDEDWGEAVMAVVETAAAADHEQALRAWCEDRLAKYKQPRHYRFTEALPRDPNGKLYKRRLREPYWVGRNRGGAD